jgi:uncharacterized membrane protein
MNYDQLITSATHVTEAIGILVLLMGGGIAGIVFAREWRLHGLNSAYHQLRANLGRAILLGLEILIIADIIGTVAMEPTFENLAVLGLIVLIRTFLSFALEIEIGGTLPWRRPSEDAPHQGPSRAAEGATL